MKPIRLCLTTVTALLVVACQDRRVASPTSFLIQDANNNGGNPHFDWLPPMVSQPPGFSGTFDASLSPVVEIRQLAGAVACSDQVIATFTTTTGPGSETVRVDPTGQYVVNWHTGDFTLNSACTYRIRFLVAGLTLGLADVDLVDTGGQLKRVDTDEFVPLLDDRTLPIKARVEQGALFFAATGDDACRLGRDCGEAIVTGGQDATVLTLQKLAGVFIPANALPSGEQIVVAIEQRTDRPCVPMFAMGLPQFNDCYRYVAVPVSSDPLSAVPQAREGEFNPPFRFEQDVTVGMCVDISGLTPAQAHFLDIFRFEPNPTEGIPRLEALADAPATFLPCDPNFVPTGGGGLGGRLQRGWRFVMNGLHSLVGPRTAYAAAAVTHQGLGGGSCCFSYFTWGYPAIMTPVGDTSFSLPAGSAVTPAPAVTMTDSSGAPIAGVTVTFSVDAVSGTISGAVVPTGADGVAQIGSWTLPSTAGPYTLTVTAPGAANSPRHFIVTSAGTLGRLDPAGGVGTPPITVAARLAAGIMYVWSGLGGLGIAG
jgi:hypothetical protein